MEHRGDPHGEPPDEAVEQQQEEAPEEDEADAGEGVIREGEQGVGGQFE